MITCVSNKKVYRTKEIAEDALIEAHSQFQYKENSGPIAVYHCEDCGYFHLTSRGPINARLQEMMKDGKIKRQQEANDWLHKLKKR